MKKISIKMIAKVLAFSMVIGSLALGGVHGGNTANAAKIKLNKTKLKLKVGEKDLLYVNGSKKKVKWSSSNKKIAKVSGGVVTAKKAGKCTIKAKVGKKKLSCKVTVSKKSSSKKAPAVSAAPVGNTLSNSELASKITVNIQPVVKSGTVLFTITNNNNSLIDTYKVSYQFANAAGGAVDSGTMSGCALSPGATQYNVIYVGKEKVRTIDATKSSVSTTVENFVYAHYTDATSEVAVTLGEGSDASKVPVTLVNSGASKNFVRGVAIFTDVSGNILLAESIYTSVDGGATKFDEVLIPYDTDETGAYVKDATGQWIRVQYAAKKVLYNAYRS